MVAFKIIVTFFSIMHTFSITTFWLFTAHFLQDCVGEIFSIAHFKDQDTLSPRSHFYFFANPFQKISRQLLHSYSITNSIYNKKVTELFKGVGVFYFIY